MFDGRCLCADPDDEGRDRRPPVGRGCPAIEPRSRRSGPSPRGARRYASIGLPSPVASCGRIVPPPLQETRARRCRSPAPGSAQRPKARRERTCSNTRRSQKARGHGADRSVRGGVLRGGASLSVGAAVRTRRTAEPPAPEKSLEPGWRKKPFAAARRSRASTARRRHPDPRRAARPHAPGQRPGPGDRRGRRRPLPPGHRIRRSGRTVSPSPGRGIAAIAPAAEFGGHPPGGPGGFPSRRPSSRPRGPPCRIGFARSRAASSVERTSRFGTALARERPSQRSRPCRKLDPQRRADVRGSAARAAPSTRRGAFGCRGLFGRIKWRRRRANRRGARSDRRAAAARPRNRAVPARPEHAFHTRSRCGRDRRRRRLAVTGLGRLAEHELHRVDLGHRAVAAGERGAGASATRKSRDAVVADRKPPGPKERQWASRSASTSASSCEASR